MIVKTLQDVLGTKGEAKGNNWRSLRLLHAEDGMGVTIADGTLEPGFDMVLWQKEPFGGLFLHRRARDGRRAGYRQGS